MSPSFIDNGASSILYEEMITSLKVITSTGALSEIVNWPVLLTLTPLACLTSGALGLTFGTRFDPRTVPMLFGIVVLPLTFLGAIYYPWAALQNVRWLQVLVLVNPLIYISEGLRAALTPVPHMSLWAVYPAMCAFTGFLGVLGIRGFRKRVLT